MERFLASGARPPMLAPLGVHAESGMDEYWMAGAMRCNPPLNPLIDVGATSILLLRFFAKARPSGRTDNQAELPVNYR